MSCDRVVCGVDSCGRLVCRPECAVMRLAERGEEIEPVTLRFGGKDGNGRWILIIHIPLTAPDGTGTWLVHCACDVDRAHRTEEYLSRIASRFRAAHPPRSLPGSPDLTKREKEIVELLAKDEEPHRIAAQLHVSYTTVRNHIQHILAKLEVHSIQEAVAVHILGGPGTARK